MIEGQKRNKQQSRGFWVTGAPKKDIIVTGVLAGNNTFLTENITQDRKKIHNSVKTYDILIK